MAYTLTEAAKATGRGKTTLLRMIKTGRLTGSRDPLTGGWTVEPAELHRLYPPAEHGAPVLAHHSVPRTADLEGRLADAHETIRDLRARLDAATALAADAVQQMRRLTDQRPRRWWQRRPQNAS